MDAPHTRPSIVDAQACWRKSACHSMLIRKVDLQNRSLHYMSSVRSEHNPVRCWRNLHHTSWLYLCSTGNEYFLDIFRMDVPVTSSLSVRFFPVCAFVFFDLCSNGYRKTYNTEFLVSLCAPPHIFDVFNALPTGHRDVTAGDGEDIQSLLDHFAGGNDDDSIGHNHANDYASQEFDLLDRIFHWMDPVTIINERNRRAFEACILIEAGQSVDEGATTDENTLHEIMRVSYTRLLRDIPADRFESVAVRDAMLLQLKGGKEPSFSGKTLWRQQKEARKSVRTLAAEMPGATNFHSLPSGHSLRDAMKRLVCKKFIVRKGAKKVYEDLQL
ncbi:hypothetical protein ACHAXH_009993 [Discostella pseudostelligera]